MKDFTDALVEVYDSDWTEDDDWDTEGPNEPVVVNDVWVGSYVGDGEYEGGGLYAQYESASDDFEDLYNGLELAVKNGIKDGTNTQEELDALEYVEKFIFYLSDGRELEFEC